MTEANGEKGGDQVKNLRKENEELKKQLFEVQKDLKSRKE